MNCLEIEVASDVDESLYDDIDFWVHFAKQNGVEELYVYFRYLDDKLEIEFTREADDDSSSSSVSREELDVASLPKYLYSSCPSLKVLSLKGCQLQIHGNLHCNQLKSLTIHGFHFDNHTISLVLSCSPQLEVFIFTLEAMNEDLSIESSSLKRLSIDRYLQFIDGQPSGETELKISTPNLQTLEIYGVPHGYYLLMNVSCLTSATLGFYGPERYEDGFFNYDYPVEDALNEILPTMEHVEDLTLSDWCTQMLVRMKKKCWLSPLLSVKYLKLMINASFDEHRQIVGLLEIFPNLKTLVVQHQNVVIANYSYQIRRARESLEFETKLPISFPLQLRTIEVTWAEGGNSIFPLIEIVLKHASKLEKMVFRVKGTIPSNSLFLASQKLQRMTRSSPTAQLIFCGFRVDW
ncbi:hypothetical protein C2S51_026520 [Perilla frutescens var. frutescens]|nr:hypothetical protein C2S51_026520 [Perilla frutescens var. frutescens]